MRGKLNWFSMGETGMKFEMNSLEKVSVGCCETSENRLSKPNENLLVF